MLSKLRYSTGLSSAYEALKNTFEHLAKGFRENPTQSANITFGASLLATAAMQMPPDVASQIMNFVQTTVHNLSNNPLNTLSNTAETAHAVAQGLIPQATTLATLTKPAKDSLLEPVTETLDFPLRSKGTTPLENMRTPFGLISAYWTSEKWAGAWGRTALAFGLETADSVLTVASGVAGASFLAATGKEFLSEATANVSFMEHLSNLSEPAGIAGGLLTLLAAEKYLANETVMNLQRTGTRWDIAQAHDALKLPGVLPALSRGNYNTHDNKDLKVPEHIEQIIGSQMTNLKGHVLHMSFTVWGSLATLAAAGYGLVKNSEEVEFLNQWGRDFLNWAPEDYGTAILAGASLACIPPITYGAHKIGERMRENFKAMANFDSAHRTHLLHGLNDAEKITASDGIQAHLNEAAGIYERGIDTQWQINARTANNFDLYTKVFKAFGLVGVSYAAAAPPLLTGAISFEDFMTNGALTASFLNSAAMWVDIMPVSKALQSSTDQIIDFTRVAHAAADTDSYYSKTGRRAFDYQTQPAENGLTLQNLCLMKQGHDSPAFLTIKDAVFLPGSRTQIIGHNGCGKTTLLNTIYGKGLQQHGEGHIHLPEGMSIFYATQEPYIPKTMSLKELVTYRHPADKFEDQDVLEALQKVGLVEKKDLLSQTDQYEKIKSNNNGQGWKFSGGEKNKLILARILLQKPDILLLDEATAALDPQAAKDFHDILREELPYTTIIAIDHSPTTPHYSDGTLVYEQTLRINNGYGAVAKVSPEDIKRNNAIQAFNKDIPFSEAPDLKS